MFIEITTLFLIYLTKGVNYLIIENWEIILKREIDKLYINQMGNSSFRVLQQKEFIYLFIIIRHHKHNLFQIII